VDPVARHVVHGRRKVPDAIVLRAAGAERIVVMLMRHDGRRVRPGDSGIAGWPGMPIVPVTIIDDAVTSKRWRRAGALARSRTTRHLLAFHGVPEHSWRKESLPRAVRTD
jgi:hypothetical protein